jgi:hypothetical protein
MTKSNKIDTASTLMTMLTIIIKAETISKKLLMEINMTDIEAIVMTIIQEKLMILVLMIALATYLT